MNPQPFVEMTFDSALLAHMCLMILALCAVISDDLALVVPSDEHTGNDHDDSCTHCKGLYSLYKEGIRKMIRYFCQVEEEELDLNVRRFHIFLKAQSNTFDRILDTTERFCWVQAVLEILRCYCTPDKMNFVLEALEGSVHENDIKEDNYLRICQSVQKVYKIRDALNDNPRAVGCEGNNVLCVFMDDIKD